MHQNQYQRNQNRLEASLCRHWPEVTYLLSLGSATLEHLLKKYGSADCIAAKAKEAKQAMRKIGGNFLSQTKINQVIASAGTTLGMRCTDAEARYLQALATEMAHSRLQGNRAKRKLEALIDNDDELRELGHLIGRVTTAILLSVHLDPRKFTCAKRFQKAMGLNLKEKSSGRYVGQLKLTKRGSSRARQYLYFAALRLIQKDPIVKQWYLSKVNPKAKNKTVIAVLRKLSKALWHVSRGQAFNASLLFRLPKKVA